LLQQLFEPELELLHRKTFGEEIIRPGFHGLDGTFDGAVRGDHHQHCFRLVFFAGFQNFKTVGFDRDKKVRNDQIEILFTKPLERRWF